VQANYSKRRVLAKSAMQPISQAERDNRWRAMVAVRAVSDAFRRKADAPRGARS
jgi:hypothetical protein